MINSYSSPFIKFYIEGGMDVQGRTLQDYRYFSNDEMETVHDYIQWMFPLNETSQFNRSAPLLTEKDIKLSLKRGVLPHLLDSFNQFLFFLVDVRNKDRIFKRPHDHNHLRISRVIKCLRLFGKDDIAKSFFDIVCALNKDGVLDKAVSYWEEALTTELWNKE